MNAPNPRLSPSAVAVYTSSWLDRLQTAIERSGVPTWTFYLLLWLEPALGASLVLRSSGTHPWGSFSVFHGGLWASAVFADVVVGLNLFTSAPARCRSRLAVKCCNRRNRDGTHGRRSPNVRTGANEVQQFFFVTIPSVQPVTFLVVTLSLIGTLQMFDQVAILGDAAPFKSTVTLAYFVYDRMFPGGQSPEVGFAAASAMFLALFTLVVVTIQRKFIRSEAA